MMEYETVPINHKRPKNRWKAIAYEATREIAKLKQSNAELLEALTFNTVEWEDCIIELQKYGESFKSTIIEIQKLVDKNKQAIAKAREVNK